jgi:hypothetical protein
MTADHNCYDDFARERRDSAEYRKVTPKPSGLISSAKRSASAVCPSGCPRPDSPPAPA